MPKYLVEWIQRVSVEIKAESRDEAIELAVENNPDFDEKTANVYKIPERI